MSLRDLLSAGWNRFLNDLRQDPYLRYVLLVAFVLASFWIWWRVPNFAHSDEYSRLLDPMKAAGYTVSDPSLESLRRGVTDGRLLGTTFYLFGAVLAIVFVAVLISGQYQEFASLGRIGSRWELWQAVPPWFWTASILLSRLVVVILAVGSVYVLYRIGTDAYDRRTGRIAGLLLATSLGFVSIAHEAGEDVPVVFALVLVFYLAHRYVVTGRDSYFLVGCAVGGLAIAIKQNGGLSVFLLGVAFVLHATRQGRPLRRTLYRPRLLGFGLVLGGVTTFLGFPDALLVGPGPIVERMTTSWSRQTGGTAAVGGLASIGSLDWTLHAYLNGLGLPIVLVAVPAVVSGVRSIYREGLDRHVEIISLVGIGTILGVVTRFSQIATHDLVLTYPFLLLLVAVSLARLYDRRDRRWRGVVLAVLVLTAVYAVAGDVQYATEPRDRAERWLERNAPDDAEMTTYEVTIAAVATPDGVGIEHYDFDETSASGSLIPNESDFTQWMVSTPERSPRYIYLTCQRLYYRNPEHSVAKAYPARARYVRELVGGEHGYDVVARFGEPREGALTKNRQDLLLAGIVPRATNVRECVWILERDGRPSRSGSGTG